MRSEPSPKAAFRRPVHGDHGRFDSIVTALTNIINRALDTIV
jgi:hypothetical protein